MARNPSFVAEDQSEVTAFLAAHLRPEKRIDTHGAVVFLTGQRACKMKRAVKFPYMDYSTLALRDSGSPDRRIGSRDSRHLPGRAGARSPRCTPARPGYPGRASCVAQS